MHVAGRRCEVRLYILKLSYFIPLYLLSLLQISIVALKKAGLCVSDGSIFSGPAFVLDHQFAPCRHRMNKLDKMIVGHNTVPGCNK